MENSEDFLYNKYGHFPNAVYFQNYQRGIAKEALDAEKEEEALYHLVESHAPYQRLVINSLKKEDSEKLDQMGFNCTDSKIQDNMEVLKQKVKELPKEWTIVQLTPFMNIAECYNLQNTPYTNPLFLSVINGGGGLDKPFVITLKAPKDSNGKHINIRERFQEIMTDFKTLYNTKWTDVFKNYQRSYAEKRVYLDCQMKLCTNQLSNDWLMEWKCFLMSSFENEEHNELLSSKLEEFLQQHDLQDLSERTKIILKHLFRGASFLSSVELIRALRATVSHKLNSSFSKEFLKRSLQLNFHNLSRNPLILILDEKLEIYPWEMIPILQNTPVTRMPSFHFMHSLYNHHKARIQDGYLTGLNYDNGAYLINPGVDLPAMQERMSSFMSYWMPQWEGIVGRPPTEEEFEGLLQKGDIFVYNGHGDGCQFLNGDRIKYLHIKAVVFLFGCASVSYRYSGPICALYTTLQHYLSACCPCLLGMLYEVGDKDTDLMATSLLSTWIPSEAPRKWGEIDKRKWMHSEIKDIDSLPSINEEQSSCIDESNLLLVLAKVKTNNKLSCITRSAFVARGLPIR